MIVTVTDSGSATDSQTLAIQVLEDTQEISSEFMKLSELGNLVELYKQSYEELK